VKKKPTDAKINVRGTDITVIRQQVEDYISLTDIAKPDFVPPRFRSSRFRSADFVPPPQLSQNFECPTLYESDF